MNNLPQIQHPNNITYPIVSIWSDRINYRASAVGGCLRSLWAARNHFTPKPITEKFQAIFNRGHELEEITKDILRANDWVIVNNGYEVNCTLGAMVELLPINIVGHIDCESRSQYTKRFIVTEIKGFGKDFLHRYQSTDINGFPMYAAQVSAYVHGRKTEGGYTNWRFIVYDKTRTTLPEDHITRLIIRDYEKPPLTKTELRELILPVELMTVNNRTDPGQMQCINSYPCPFFYLHDEPTYIQLSTKQLAMVRAIRAFDDKIKQLEQSKQKFRHVLQGQLATGMKYSGSNFKVYFSDKPDRLNQEAAKTILSSAGVDYTDYMIKGEGKQMNIRENRKTKAEE